MEQSHEARILESLHRHYREHAAKVMRECFGPDYVYDPMDARQEHEAKLRALGNRK